MADTVDLFEYIPEFLAEYREMRLLLLAEQPELQAYANETERVLDELFIQTADADGIARFETILGILPSIYDTLDIRRTRVMSRWNDVTPYTVKTLKQKISAIQGNDDIEITIDGYEITIVTKCERRGQVDDLQALLKVIIPCNLKVIAENKIIGDIMGGAFYGMGVSPTDTIFLTNDLTGDYATVGNAVATISPVPTDTLFLTNDLTGDCIISGNALGSAGLSDTGIISF